MDIWLLFTDAMGTRQMSEVLGQVQTRVPLLRFYSVIPIWTIYLLKLTFTFLFEYCIIVDWMKWGWFCVSHLCTILMGQSGIVKVIVFFETLSM